MSCQSRPRGWVVPLGLVLATPLLMMLVNLARWGRLDVVWNETGWLVAATTEYYGRSAAFFLAEAPLLLAALLVIIVVHEAGHALAAWLTGDEVTEVSLGLGPVVARARAGGTRFVVRALPLMGHTRTVATGGSGARARRAVHLAAGPLAHAGVVLAAVLAGTSGGFARHLAWFGGMTLVVNLVPHRAGGRQATDGLQLVELFFGEDSTADEVSPLAAPAYARAVDCHRRRDLEGAQDWCEQGLAADPADTATEALLVAVLLERDDLREARRRAADLLTRELPPVRRAVTQCNLAYADLLLDDPELVLEAADAAARAYATLPWEPAVQAARAYVAITQGQVEEGLALVSQALTAEPDATQRAGMLAVRATGQCRRGRFRDAEGDLREARRLNPDDVLLPRAAAEIERCRRLAAGTPGP